MTVLAHILASISPASRAHAEGARLNVAAAGAPLLERLAIRLGGAQHTARPRAANKCLFVVAGDHGVGDPGVSLGADHPTVILARAITDGSAALAQIALQSRTPVFLIDAGAAERAHMPATAFAHSRGPSRNLLVEPAMTVVDAALGLENGIALAVATVDQHRTDLLAVGAIGVGAEVASAALLGAALGTPPTELRDGDAEAAGTLGAREHGSSGLERLARFGGPDTAVLAGILLAAASMNVPVLLDDYATGAAALVAVALAPAVVGYLIAAHTGTFTQPRILAHLGLSPVFGVGLGHGEGTGAAMVLPLAEQVAALSARG